MARVASNHFQGVIVFDEIQDLSEAKSGGATRMLNFFVQLENTLSIPFILIATPKARALFSGEFRQARRISEQGDIYWRPMRQLEEKQNHSDIDVVDTDWSDFVRAMWRYWYLRKEHPLPENLLDEPVVETLYKYSRGITALVVTIFFLAQRRAIVSHKEDLTEKVIKSAVSDNQYFINQVLDQLKENSRAKSGHRGASDLDRSEWGLRQSALHTYVNGENQKLQSHSPSVDRKVQEPADAFSPPAKPNKGSKGKKAAQDYGADDFRAMKAQTPEEISRKLSAIE